MSGIIICFCVGLFCLAVGCAIGMRIHPSASCLSFDEMKKLKNGTVVFYKKRRRHAEERLGKIACHSLQKVIIDMETRSVVDIDDCDIWYAQEVEVDECE